MKYIDYSRNYQRAFHFNGINHFICDVWMVFYREVDGMITAIGNDTNYWFPKASVDAMLADGVQFFADQEAFDIYYRNHIALLDSLKTSFEEDINAPAVLTLAGVQRFLSIVPETFRYFYKTEFFYVDDAFRASETNPPMRANLEKNYVLKERARIESLNNVYYGSGSYMNILFRKLSTQFEVQGDAICQYGIEDIYGLFQNKRVADEAIQKRTVGRILFAKEGIVHSYFGKEAKLDVAELLEKTMEPSVSDLDTLRGIPASKGKVIGRVKIIVSDPSTFDSLAKEFERMQQGDILVAETTSPEFMPACRKAGAILANQGGFLSHAAVVSREFGIPAIVGLQQATTLLKDGDLVEVDGDKGIVRIIERHTAL